MVHSSASTQSLKRTICVLMFTKYSILKHLTGFSAGLMPLLSARADVIVQDPSNVVGNGVTAWNYLVVEGEAYDSKTAGDEVGFIRVDNSGSIVSSQGNPI